MDQKSCMAGDVNISYKPRPDFFVQLLVKPAMVCQTSNQAQRKEAARPFHQKCFCELASQICTDVSNSAGAAHGKI